MEFKSIQGLKLMQYLNQSDETWHASVPYSDIYLFKVSWNSV